MWVIRGGEQDELIVPFVEGGAIGVRYPEVPDAEILTRSEIRRSLAGERTVAQLDADEAIVSAFVREIQVGESVLLPDLSRGEVVVGTVTSRYEFDADATQGATHRRSVDWLARHPISDLPAPVQRVAGQKALLEQHRDAEWSAYLAQIRDGAIGRDPLDRPARIVATPVRRSGGTRAPRPPRVPKRPAPVTAATCQVCFLQTHPDRIHDGVCEDCGG